MNVLWDVQAPPYLDEDLRSLRPERVLFEYGEPLLFTVRDRHGGQLIAYFCDDSEEAPLVRRYFLAISSPRVIEALESGRCSMREALDQPRTWLADVKADWSIHRRWSMAPEEMPPDALPPAGVMLRPELEPVLTLRAVGEGIKRGSVPGEVIKHLVSGAESAFKQLVDHALNRVHAGRVPNSVRNCYSLPIKAMAFASFQVAFHDPTEAGAENGQPAVHDDAGVAAFRRAVELLKEGLEWAEEGFPPALIAAADGTKAQAILEALRSLTPSTHGKIQRLEIGGRFRAGAAPAVFSRESRREVTRAIRSLNVPSPEPFDDVGLVRELDLDECSFILRECDDSEADVQCWFEPKDLDSVHGAFNLGFRIRVLGISPAGADHVEVLHVSAHPEGS